LESIDDKSPADTRSRTEENQTIKQKKEAASWESERREERESERKESVLC
jgi:hypothetical protein